MLQRQIVPWHCVILLLTGLTSCHYLVEVDSYCREGKVLNAAKGVCETKDIGHLSDDVEPPGIEVTTPPNGTFYAKGTLAIEGEAKDRIGVARVEVSIDQGAFRLATGTTQWIYKLEATGLLDGFHVITAKATNARGKSATDTVSFGIDSSEPIVVLENRPLDPTHLTSINITISNPDIVAYKYQLDSLDWTAETDISLPISVNGLGEGQHQIRVVGKDLAGNWQYKKHATAYAWTIDLSLPDTSQNEAP